MAAWSPLHACLLAALMGAKCVWVVCGFVCGVHKRGCRDCRLITQHDTPTRMYALIPHPQRYRNRGHLWTHRQHRSPLSTGKCHARYCTPPGCVAVAAPQAGAWSGCETAAEPGLVWCWCLSEDAVSRCWWLGACWDGRVLVITMMREIRCSRRVARRCRGLAGPW